jgi:hypothetical protein
MAMQFKTEFVAFHESTSEWVMGKTCMRLWGLNDKLRCHFQVDRLAMSWKRGFIAEDRIRAWNIVINDPGRVEEAGAYQSPTKPFLMERLFRRFARGPS